MSVESFLSILGLAPLTKSSGFVHLFFLGAYAVPRRHHCDVEMQRPVDVRPRRGDLRDFGFSADFLSPNNGSISSGRVSSNEISLNHHRVYLWFVVQNQEPQRGSKFGRRLRRGRDWRIESFGRRWRRIGHRNDW